MWNEPYCGGPTGLNDHWEQGADFVVGLVKGRPHVAGVWLGDEPEVWGVGKSDVCALSLYLKKALIAANRSDVFLAYNDSPNSAGLRGDGLCAGLDYFSVDVYNDETEVSQVEALYAPLLPKLHRPNALEPNGQGVFLVPGLFWYFDPDVTTPCEAPPRGPGNPQPRGCSGNATAYPDTTPWLVAKLRQYWAYAQRTPQVAGFNYWHFDDRPTMSPSSMRRGAKTMGPALWREMGYVGHNISAAARAASTA